MTLIITQTVQIDKSLPVIGCEPMATQREATFSFMAISESVNPLEYLVQITSSKITWCVGSISCCCKNPFTESTPNKKVVSLTTLDGN